MAVSEVKGVQEIQEALILASTEYYCQYLDNIPISKILLQYIVVVNKMIHYAFSGV